MQRAASLTQRSVGFLISEPHHTSPHSLRQSVEGPRPRRHTAKAFPVERNNRHARHIIVCRSFLFIASLSFCGRWLRPPRLSISSVVLRAIRRPPCRYRRPRYIPPRRSPFPVLPTSRARPVIAPDTRPGFGLVCNHGRKSFAVVWNVSHSS